MSLQLAAAAVDVRLRNVETSAGPAYSWQVTSSVASQTQNITLYGNDTARTTFSVDIKRAPAGSGYTVSGRVVITNTPDANEAVYVTAVKMLMGPGLPWFGPTPRMLDCRSREIVPGDSVSCAFKLHLPNTATTSIKPSMDVRGQRLSVQGDTHPITFPAVSSASASDSDSSSCAIVKDRVVADGAEDGFTLSGDGAAAGLVGNGVQVCDGSASFTYTAEVGPFGGLEGICGAYQVGIWQHRSRVSVLQKVSAQHAVAAHRCTTICRNELSKQQAHFGWTNIHSQEVLRVLPCCCMAMPCSTRMLPALRLKALAAPAYRQQLAACSLEAAGRRTCWAC